MREISPRDAASVFALPGPVDSVSRYGSGHINDSYLVVCDGSAPPSRFILQRLNTEIFREPERLMENVERVTSHLRAKLEADGADLLVAGTARGRLVGGCLSILAALAGTPEQPDTEGAILLVEEVGEEAYRVDRMLGTLARAGMFDRLAGVLVGHMTRVTFGGREEPGRLRELLLDRFAPLGVPVASGLPFGHALPNVALPIGAAARWDGGARRLEIEEGIVA